MSQLKSLNAPEQTRWAVPLAVLLLAVVAYLGYTAGSSERVVTEEVDCMSGQEVIGCTLSDGWDISVPLDVAWTDASGFHESGRPDCLPPTGLGTEGPVQISWTEVETNGWAWRQVLHVACSY